VVSRVAFVLIVGVLLGASVTGAVLVTNPLRTQTQTVTIHALPITTTALHQYYVSVSFTVKVTVTANATSEELLILKKYNWDMFNVTGATINLITLDFQNVGSVPINLAASNVSVNGMPAVPPSGACGILLNPGSDCLYSFTPPNGNWVAGTLYTLQFVTSDGKVFSYPIVAGESG